MHGIEKASDQHLRLGVDEGKRATGRSWPDHRHLLQRSTDREAVASAQQNSSSVLTLIYFLRRGPTARWARSRPSRRRSSPNSNSTAKL